MPIFSIATASLGLWAVLIGCGLMNWPLVGFGMTAVLLACAELAEQFFETD